MRHEDTPLLEIENLSVRFDTKFNFRGKTIEYHEAISDLSCKLFKGDTLGVVGESGSGKSTLAKVIVGLQSPSQGKILFEGKTLEQYSKPSRRKILDGYQIIFQDPQSSLDPRMRVWDLVTEGLDIRGIKKPQRRDIAQKLLKKVGIDNTQLDSFPHEFSGGQRQRLAIARALAMEPDVLILDEPTSALDLSVQAQVINLLLELQNTLGLTYIFISHDIGVIRHLCNRVLVMKKGQLVESGDADKVLENPTEAYTKTLLAAIPKFGT